MDLRFRNYCIIISWHPFISSLFCVKCAKCIYLSDIANVNVSLLKWVRHHYVYTFEWKIKGYDGVILLLDDRDFSCHCHRCHWLALVVIFLIRSLMEYSGSTFNSLAPSRALSTSSLTRRAALTAAMRLFPSPCTVFIRSRRGRSALAAFSCSAILT